MLSFAQSLQGTCLSTLKIAVLSYVTDIMSIQLSSSFYSDKSFHETPTKQCWCKEFKIIDVISDYREATVCPLILKESEMTAGECITLEVYAEQYGVSSEKKVFGICYVGKIRQT